MIAIKYGWQSKRLLFSDCSRLSAAQRETLIEHIPTLLTPNVVKTLPPDWKAINTKDEAHRWLAQRQTEGSVLAISLRETDTVVGFAFFFKATNEAGIQTINLGYLLGEAHWHKGYASETLAAIVDYFEQSKETTVLYAGADKNNAASISVLEKCGFQQETNSNLHPDTVFYAYHTKNS